MSALSTGPSSGSSAGRSTAAVRERGAAYRRKARALAVLASVAAPVAIWLLAVPLLGNRLHVPDQPGEEPLDVGLPPVIVIALAAALSGWALLASSNRPCAGEPV
ncbi:DUF6069 family protein [Actinomadura sp. HBU206391]|uniref:DUF6069 family protein n=1 Tax=Actinomadura sp. HBU206391 TaxID=2731692 RepID=UPI00164FC005|nr:DUF6069 family protein [Actinomadura sp. HBU206391]MBC6458120.1 hypothetical protein [Actinomadura sp. HBU206391]